MTRWITGLLLAAVLTAPAQAGWLKLRADIFGDAVVDSKATYRERQRSQGLERRFKVKVEDAQPGETFAVFIGNYSVGQMTANGNGIARIKLRTPQFIDDPGDGDPMPNNFPDIQSGDVITVGSMSGTFFIRNASQSNETQRTRLRGRSDGPSDAIDGRARYLERFRNGRLLRKFKVDVEDGNPGDVLDITVNGQFVGTVRIRNSGEGDFELRTGSFIDDPGDGDPMPDSFPTLMAGDIVTVGPVSMMLEND